MVYFQTDRADTLHPEKFNCFRCERPEKDTRARPVQCPKCELTAKLEIYKEEILVQIKRFVGPMPKGYTLQSLMALYRQVGEILARNHNRISRTWTVRLAALARIILDERNQLRAIDSFEQAEKLRQQRGRPSRQLPVINIPQ
jgi:hypothetical protein